MELRINRVRINRARPVQAKTGSIALNGEQGRGYLYPDSMDTKYIETGAFYYTLLLS